MISSLSIVFRALSLTTAACCAWGSSVYGQNASANLSTPDSIRLFTDSVLSLIEERSLYTDSLNWADYRPTFVERVINESRFADILPHFSDLWDILGDHHSGIGYAGKRYSASSKLDTTALNERMLQAFRRRKQWSTQTAVLLEKYGYVAIPSISTQDDSLATQRAAGALQDSLCRIAQLEVDGWIIDLRRNLGGNMYAMLGGIHQLVGPGTFSYLVNKDDSIKSFWRVGSSGIYEGERRQITLPRSCTLPDSSLSIAVLVGPLTASSGEITALAFLGGENVTIIGEPSAGYMTGNEFYRLPFGAYLTLAEVYETDRHKVRMMRIDPDILVEGGDNFANPHSDAKIQAALEWLSADKP